MTIPHDEMVTARRLAISQMPKMLWKHLKRLSQWSDCLKWTDLALVHNSQISLRTEFIAIDFSKFAVGANW